MFLGDIMESSSLDSTVSSLTMDDNEHIPHQFSSMTKLHNNGPSTTSVHELLECPVCTCSMYPPIHQCHNGHTLCSTCKTRVHNRCPTCRQEWFETLVMRYFNLCSV